MQHYRLNNPPKALPGRIGAELSRFVQHTDALVVTMIEVAPPHHRRLTRATVLSVPFPATSLFEEHVLPKVLLGDTDAAIDERAFVLVKTLPPRPEWKRRWILTAGPQAQIPSDVLTGTASAGVAFHYSRRGVVGLFAAAQDESERLAAFTQAGWSVSPAPPGFLAQLVMAMQTRPIAFQPFLWGIDPTSVALDDDGAVDAAALLAPTEAPVLRSAAELRPRPLALASADAPRGFPLGVSATGQALKLVWNAVSIGVDASGDRLAHALQSFAVRALEQEINVIALLPRDLNVQYALLPLEDAERVLVFDGQNRWKSASLPWKTLAVEHLNAILRRFGARGDVSSPYPATFAEALMAAGIPAAATEALRILTAPEGDDLNEVIGLGNGVLLLLNEPTDMLAADLLLALIAATGIRRPILLIRPEGITLPRPLSEVAIQLVVDPKTMRLMLRDGGDHWMFEEHGAQPVMMLPDLMAEGQAVEGVEEDLVDGLGRDLVPSASPRSDAVGAAPPSARGEDESGVSEPGDDAQEDAPEPDEVAIPDAGEGQVEEPAASPIADEVLAEWGATPAADETLSIEWGTPPDLDTLAELEQAGDLRAAVEPDELPSLLEPSVELEMPASEAPLLGRQDEAEATAAEVETQPFEDAPELAPSIDSELPSPAALDEHADLALVVDGGETYDNLTAGAEELASVAFGEGEGDELEAVQFGDDDGLLDLDALGISLPAQPEMAAELNASALSLPAEDGRFGPISGVPEAVEAAVAHGGFAGQDAKEAVVVALRKQTTDEAPVEAPASARRRVTPGQRGRRRMPAVAFFESDESGDEPEAVSELSITSERAPAASALATTLETGEVTEFDADVEALLEMGALAVEAPAEREAALEPVAERELVEEAPAELEAAPEPVAELEAALEPVAEREPVEEAPAELEAAPEPVAELEAALEPVAEREPVEEASAELEAALEPVAELEAALEPVAEREPVVASLAAADSAFAQGNLDAAEAGYRAVIESDRVEDHRAARLGIGRIIAARRNPVAKPVVEAPAEPLKANAPAEPAPTPAIEEDRWSDAALFAAWSRGESIISLSRAYAAANPALTLAGAMARVREVVTSYAATTAKSFPANAQVVAGSAGVASETRPAEPATVLLNSIAEPTAITCKTRLAEPAEHTVKAPLDILSVLEIPDTTPAPMTNGSSVEGHEPMTNGSSVEGHEPMTNGSSVLVGEHAQTRLSDALFSDADEDDVRVNAGPFVLSLSQLSALVEAIKEDELAHRTTRIGKNVRVNWRKGFNIREQSRVLGKDMPAADEDTLKRIVDAAIIPDILVKYGDKMPSVLEAILGVTNDEEAKAAFEQVLLTLTQSKSLLRGSVRQRTIERLRRYLEHRLSTLSITTTDEVLHAA